MDAFCYPDPFSLSRCGSGSDRIRIRIHNTAQKAAQGRLFFNLFPRLLILIAVLCLKLSPPMQVFPPNHCRWLDDALDAVPTSNNAALDALLPLWCCCSSPFYPIASLFSDALPYLDAILYHNRLLLLLPLLLFHPLMLLLSTMLLHFLMLLNYLYSEQLHRYKMPLNLYKIMHPFLRVANPDPLSTKRPYNSILSLYKIV